MNITSQMVQGQLTMVTNGRYILHRHKQGLISDNNTFLHYHYNIFLPRFLNSVGHLAPLKEF